MPESLFKRLYYRFFPVNFLKFAGPLFLQSTFGRLFLYLDPCQVSMIDLFCGNRKSLTVFAKKPHHISLRGFFDHSLLAVSFLYILHEDRGAVVHKYY